MTIIYKLNLTAREAAVVYASLSKMQWSESNGETELSVRCKLVSEMVEKIGVQKTWSCIDDLLIETYEMEVML